MAKTKGDLVLKALRKAGLYSNATLTDADPQAIEDAINDLEDMMAAWQAKVSSLGISLLIQKTASCRYLTMIQVSLHGQMMASL